MSPEPEFPLSITFGIKGFDPTLHSQEHLECLTRATTLLYFDKNNRYIIPLLPETQNRFIRFSEALTEQADSLVILATPQSEALHFLLTKTRERIVSTVLLLSLGQVESACIVTRSLFEHLMMLSRVACHGVGAQFMSGALQDVSAETLSSNFPIPIHEIFYQASESLYGKFSKFVHPTNHLEPATVFDSWILSQPALHDALCNRLNVEPERDLNQFALDLISMIEIAYVPLIRLMVDANRFSPYLILEKQFGIQYFRLMLRAVLRNAKSWDELLSNVDDTVSWLKRRSSLFVAQGIARPDWTIGETVVAEAQSDFKQFLAAHSVDTLEKFESKALANGGTREQLIEAFDIRATLPLSLREFLSLG